MEECLHDCIEIGDKEFTIAIHPDEQDEEFPCELLLTLGQDDMYTYGYLGRFPCIEGQVYANVPWHAARVWYWSHARWTHEHTKVQDHGCLKDGGKIIISMVWILTNVCVGWRVIRDGNDIHDGFISQRGTESDYWGFAANETRGRRRTDS